MIFAFKNSKFRFLLISNSNNVKTFMFFSSFIFDYKFISKINKCVSIGSEALSEDESLLMVSSNLINFDDFINVVEYLCHYNNVIFINKLFINFTVYNFNFDVRIKFS